MSPTLSHAAVAERVAAGARRGALNVALDVALTLALTTALAGCATPAVDVKVPTSAMEDAYRASVAAAASLGAAPPRSAARIVETTIRPDRPAPIVAAPDIRLAFFYQWVDAEGNLHYPNWVAIPVETFRWVVPELAPAGGTLPLDGSRSQSAPADPVPSPASRHGSDPRSQSRHR